MPGYIKIEALRMLRNKRYVIFVVAFPVAFYLLSVNLYGGGTDAAGVGADVVLMVSMSAYGALAASMMSTVVPWAQAVAHVMPSFHYTDMGQSIVAGHGVPPSDALTVGAWAVALGVVAVAAYRRATARG